MVDTCGGDGPNGNLKPPHGKILESMAHGTLATSDRNLLRLLLIGVKTCGYKSSLLYVADVKIQHRSKQRLA